MRFWDASGLVPLLVEEAETGRARAWLREDPGVVAWWGTRVECASALARVARESGREMAGATALLEELWHGVFEVEPTEAVRTTALRLLPVHPLRSADALQLAAALAWREGEPLGAELVSLDERLRAAARAEGFALLP